MSIRVDWEDIERTVMTITFDGEWSISDLKKALEAAAFMQSGTREPVVTIYNLLSSIPSGNHCQDITKRQIHRHTPPSTTRIIFVSEEPILHVFLDMLDHSKPFHNRHYSIDFADSMYEARAMVGIQNKISY